MQPLELEIIEEIRRRAGQVCQTSIQLGIGDDAAVVLAPKSGEEIVLTTDQLVENTHFHRQQHPPQALGHKTLARGLSDIAAMGGTPLHFLLSLCLPTWAAEGWLKRYLSGLFRLSRVCLTPLVGGDVAYGQRFTAQVVVMGSIPKSSALRRDGAKPGDAIYVSGRLGGSALGLERLEKGETTGAAVRRHLYPQPRLELGRYLRKELKATAALDLSDGLSMDLARLTKASKVGADIEASRVPRFRGASLSQALHGGEEYELLFTVPTGVEVPRKFERIPLTAIGHMRSKRGVTLRTRDGDRDLEAKGFHHFERRQ